MTDSFSVAVSGKSGEQLDIAHDAAWYTAATYISQIVAFATGIVIKRFIGPTGLGIWTMLTVFLSYLSILEFGVTQAATKEIAYELGKGDEDQVERLKGTQFSFVTLTALIGLSGIVAYVVIRCDKLSPEFLIGLLVIGFCFPVLQIQLAHMTIFWVNKEFRATSLMMLLETLSNTVLGIFLVWQYGVYGLFFNFAITLFIKLGYLLLMAKCSAHLCIRFSWNKAVLKRLLGVGIPLQIVSLVAILKLSLATILVAYFLGTTAVGCYALALSIQTYIYMMPNSFSIIMFPRLQERFAMNKNDASTLLTFLSKPLRGLAFFVLPLLISVSYFLAPVLIRQILPEFEPTILVLKVLLAGTFFLSMEHMPGQIITTTNRLWQRVGLGLLSTIILIVCMAGAVSYGATLVKIACAVTFANTLGFFIGFFYAFSLIGNPRSERWLWAKLLGTFTYLMLSLIVIDQALPTWGDSLLRDFGMAFAKLAISLITFLPLFLIAEHNLSIVQTIRILILSRLSGASHVA